MDPTTVQLVCPSCDHAWQRQPQELPETSQDLECPACGTVNTTAEFARSDRDVQAINQFE